MNSGEAVNQVRAAIKSLQNVERFLVGEAPDGPPAAALAKIAWGKGGQKNRKVQRSPIPVDFARYLSRFDSGPIVDCPLARKTISTRLHDAGQGITAKDLRKTCGTRWALRVHPFALKAMMRHKSLETTMTYYVDLATDEVADQFWQDVHADVHAARVGHNRA